MVRSKRVSVEVTAALRDEERSAHLLLSVSTSPYSPTRLKGDPRPCSTASTDCILSKDCFFTTAAMRASPVCPLTPCPIWPNAHTVFPNSCSSMLPQVAVTLDISDILILLERYSKESFIFAKPYNAMDVSFVPISGPSLEQTPSRAILILGDRVGYWQPMTPREYMIVE